MKIIDTKALEEQYRNSYYKSDGVDKSHTEIIIPIRTERNNMSFTVFTEYEKYAVLLKSPAEVFFENLSEKIPCKVSIDKDGYIYLACEATNKETYCCVRFSDGSIYIPTLYNQADKSKVVFVGTKEKCNEYYMSHSPFYKKQQELEKQAKEKLKESMEEIAKERNLHCDPDFLNSLVDIVTADPVLGDIVSVYYTKPTIM